MLPRLDFQTLYARFDLPVTDIDCGLMCAPRNPGGKPVCCDICHAVPAAYRQEWEDLHQGGDFWRLYRGDECPGASADTAALLADAAALLAETPEHMLLAACLGPAQCQRQQRLVSCRQFPFFPYISSNYRFLGLAGEWAFTGDCWVLQHLEAVRDDYRTAFVAVYDQILAQWQEELEGYAIHSEHCREYYANARRRIPLLHRRGGMALISPLSERLRWVKRE